MNNSITTTGGGGELFDAWGGNNSSDSQQHRYAELEFTEDPFKDVAFGLAVSDPFASSTNNNNEDNDDDDPFAVPPTSNGAAMKKKAVDNFDPFSSMDNKDPFASITSPLSTKSTNNKMTTSTMSVDFESAFSGAWNGGGSGRSDPFDNNNKSAITNWAGGGGDDDFKFASSPVAAKSTNSSLIMKSPTSSSSSLSSSSLTPLKLGKLTHSTSKGGQRQQSGQESREMAWVAADSVRLEEERRRKAELQEKADLEMAIALSKSEMPINQPSTDRLI